MNIFEELKEKMAECCGTYGASSGCGTFCNLVAMFDEAEAKAKAVIQKLKKNVPEYFQYESYYGALRDLEKELFGDQK